MLKVSLLSCGDNDASQERADMRVAHRMTRKPRMPRSLEFLRTSPFAHSQFILIYFFLEICAIFQ